MQTMNAKVQGLKEFLGHPGRIALVEVAATKGSTPSIVTRIVSPTVSRLGRA